MVRAFVHQYRPFKVTLRIKRNMDEEKLQETGALLKLAQEKPLLEMQDHCAQAFGMESTADFIQILPEQNRFAVKASVNVTLTSIPPEKPKTQ